MAKPLTQTNVTNKLAKLPGWNTNKAASKITRTFKTDNFLSGLALVTQIAVRAEAANHHPDVTLSYGSVKVTLTSHDAGGLTNRDFSLASAISKLQQS